MVGLDGTLTIECNLMNSSGWRVVLHNYGAGGADLWVFLQSDLNFWFPLPGSGQREVKWPCRTAPCSPRESLQGSRSVESAVAQTHGNEGIC